MKVTVSSRVELRSAVGMIAGSALADDDSRACSGSEAGRTHECEAGPEGGGISESGDMHPFESEDVRLL